MEEYNKSIDRMIKILEERIVEISEERKQWKESDERWMKRWKELDEQWKSLADSTDDDSDDDCNCDDNAVVESDPVPVDSKSTSALGKCAAMEEQLKLVNQKSDVIVYEVKNDAPELFDKSFKKEEIKVAATELGKEAVDALRGFLIDSGCVSDAIEVPGATIPPEPPDTLHIIAAITDNILNLPTYPNSLQFNPAYLVVTQYFVDVDDTAPQYNYNMTWYIQYNYRITMSYVMYQYHRDTLFEIITFDPCHDWEGGVIWNYMFGEYVTNNEVLEACEFYAQMREFGANVEMRRCGFVHVEITFTTVSYVCGHCRLVEKEHRWFRAMKHETRCFLTMVIVHLLWLTWQLKELRLLQSYQLSTLVLAEHEGGSLKAQTINAITAASFLSHDSPVSVLLAGSGPSLQKAAAHAASCHPSISQVLLANSDKFTYPLAEPWAKLLQFVQERGGYSHIISTSSSFGKNILPRAAALLDVSPISDVIKISEPHLFVRPIYAGNALCTVRYFGSDPCMFSIRSTSFPVTSEAVDSKSNAAPIDQVDLSTFDEDGISKSKYIKQTTQESERPDLGNARVVITGGRALKSAENFKMVERLAEKLGAAVGATRAAVDAGYVPNELQVGQTGKIVAPELYMAFGVSGAIQHLAGMRDSKVIVAVNKDADAPIFQVADYGLVGDLFEVIPELLEKMPDKK